MIPSIFVSIWRPSAHDRGGFLVQHGFRSRPMWLDWRLLNPVIRVSDLKNVLGPYQHAEGLAQRCEARSSRIERLCVEENPRRSDSADIVVGIGCIHVYPYAGYRQEASTRDFHLEFCSSMIAFPARWPSGVGDSDCVLRRFRIWDSDCLRSGGGFGAAPKATPTNSSTTVCRHRARCAAGSRACRNQQWKCAARCVIR